MEARPRKNSEQQWLSKALILLACNHQTKKLSQDVSSLWFLKEFFALLLSSDRIAVFCSNYYSSQEKAYCSEIAIAKNTMFSYFLHPFLYFFYTHLFLEYVLNKLNIYAFYTIVCTPSASEVAGRRSSQVASNCSQCDRAVFGVD
jgi:hypothetical protein